MLETEVLSLMPKHEFDKKVKEFVGKFGKPIIQNRVSVSLSSYATQIDTGIKITNGKVHIVQKTGGEFSHLLIRQEIDIDLNVSVHELIKIIRMIQNIGSTINGFTSHLQQFENRLFKVPGGEIKMYHQFGKTDFYGFELEIEEGVDMDAKLAELGLAIDNEERTHAYWREYDKTVNFDCLKMSDLELEEVIKKYI